MDYDKILNILLDPIYKIISLIYYLRNIITFDVLKERQDKNTLEGENLNLKVSAKIHILARDPRPTTPA